jgi:polyribonucleotide nucleotidyltransferase
MDKAQRSLGVNMLKEDALFSLNAEIGEGKFTDVVLNVVFEYLQYKAYR